MGAAFDDRHATPADRRVGARARARGAGATQRARPAGRGTLRGARLSLRSPLAPPPARPRVGARGRGAARGDRPRGRPSLPRRRRRAPPPPGRGALLQRFFFGGGRRGLLTAMARMAGARRRGAAALLAAAAALAAAGGVGAADTKPQPQLCVGTKPGKCDVIENNVPAAMYAPPKKVRSPRRRKIQHPFPSRAESSATCPPPRSARAPPPRARGSRSSRVPHASELGGRAAKVGVVRRRCSADEQCSHDPRLTAS